MNSLEIFKMEIKSVLIICSDTTDNFINKKVFEICGIWNILFFSNPDIALDYLLNETEHPDLIIIDICKVSMKEFRFVNQYHEMNQFTRKSKIIILSESIEPVDGKKVIKKLLHFIEKPLSVKKIRNIFLPINQLEKNKKFS